MYIPGYNSQKTGITETKGYTEILNTHSDCVISRLLTNSKQKVIYFFLVGQYEQQKQD